MRHPRRRPLCATVLFTLVSLLSSCSGAAETERPSTADTTVVADGSALGYKLRDVGPAGGIVFYVSRTPFPCGENLESFCNYLEVAPFDSEVRRSWSAGEPTAAGLAGGSAIGTGWANTADIIAQGNTDPATSAAAYADAYEHGGKDDWYLPSRDECHELTITREVIGGFMLDTYWTSTGRASGLAWYQDFLNGFQFTETTSTEFLVRPIRAF